MIDPTYFEKSCMQKVIPSLGEFIAKIGPHKTFNDFTREEIIMMIEVIVTVYMEEISQDEIPF